MKIKAFDIFEKEDYENLVKFVENHQVIDVKPVGAENFYSVIVLYLNYKIKYFNESEYEDLSDTYARMQDAVNKFCSDHNVVNIEITQNGDEDLVTVVTYKE